MALVSVVIIGIHLFSDIGIHAALIQNEREDADFVNTMWAPQHLGLWRRYRDTGHLFFEETDH